MLHRMFKALADPTRLRILNLLMKVPCCVCDFGTVLQLPQPLISRHLAYLKNAGLVQDHRQGMRVQYAISLNEQNSKASSAVPCPRIRPVAKTCDGEGKLRINLPAGPETRSHRVLWHKSKGDL